MNILAILEGIQMKKKSNITRYQSFQLGLRYWKSADNFLRKPAMEQWLWNTLELL